MIKEYTDIRSVLYFSLDLLSCKLSVYPAVCMWAVFMSNCELFN